MTQKWGICGFFVGLGNGCLQNDFFCEESLYVVKLAS